MENNLLNDRLKDTDNKDCHHTVQTFLSDTLGIIKLDDGIYKVCGMAVVSFPSFELIDSCLCYAEFCSLPDTYI